MHVPGAERLVPYVFSVIIFTVVIYGLLAKPASKWLNVGSPDNLGVVIAGANRVAQQIGKTLKEMGCDVVLVDTNYNAAGQARMAGLRSVFGNVLDQSVVEPFEFSHFGRLIAMTQSDKLNLLAALRFAPLFGKANVYRVAPAAPASTQTEVTVPGDILSASDLTFDRLQSLLSLGGRIVSTKLSEQFTFNKLKEVHGQDLKVLFVQSADGAVNVHSPKSPPYKPGDNLVFVTGKAKPAAERKPESTESTHSSS
jgi:NhaP-type Na+/H+ or K+/H+ antiporter